MRTPGRIRRRSRTGRLRRPGRGTRHRSRDGGRGSPHRPRGNRRPARPTRGRRGRYRGGEVVAAGRSGRACGSGDRRGRRRGERHRPPGPKYEPTVRAGVMVSLEHRPCRLTPKLSGPGPPGSLDLRASYRGGPGPLQRRVRRGRLDPIEALAAAAPPPAAERRPGQKIYPGESDGAGPTGVTRACPCRPRRSWSADHTSRAGLVHDLAATPACTGRLPSSPAA